MDKKKINQAGFDTKWVGRCFLLLLSIVSLAASSCAIPKIVVLQDPLSPEEHVNLGLAYEKKGETQSAIREYTQAAKGLPAAYVYLGNICYSTGAYAESEGYYRKAIKKKPDLADAYNNLAWLLYTRGGDLREALALARKALELNPSNPHYSDTVNQIDEELQQRGKPPVL